MDLRLRLLSQHEHLLCVLKLPPTLLPSKLLLQPPAARVQQTKRGVPIARRAFKIGLYHTHDGSAMASAVLLPGPRGASHVWWYMPA